MPSNQAGIKVLKMQVAEASSHTLDTKSFRLRDEELHHKLLRSKVSCTYDKPSHIVRAAYAALCIRRVKLVASTPSTRWPHLSPDAQPPHS